MPMIPVLALRYNCCVCSPAVYIGRAPIAGLSDREGPRVATMPGGKQRKKARQNAAVLVQHYDERAQQHAAADAAKRKASRALSTALSPEGSRSPSPERAAAPTDAQMEEEPVRPPGLSPSPPPTGEPQPRDSSGGPTLQAVVSSLASVERTLAALVRELAGLRSSVEKAEERARLAEDRADALQSKVAELSETAARADRRQEGLDRALRRSSMMFFGVAEGSDVSPEERVRSCLRAVGSPAVDKISEAVRLGPARAPTGSRTAVAVRPVRVSFTAPEAVYDVFKHCRALREQHKVFVDRDLTPQQRDIRASLAQEYKQLRENGRRPFWRGERLFMAGENGQRAKEFKQGDALPTGIRPQAASSAEQA